VRGDDGEMKIRARLVERAPGVMQTAGSRGLAWYSVGMKFCKLSFTFVLPLVLVGCHASSAAPSAEDQTQQRAQTESQREQLDMIPPPAKSRYMAIHNFDSWENPYITVQAGMLELHVLMADSNTTPIGVGGITRPIAARKQDLNISMDKLGEAVSSIPEGSWPYGRVIAIEEAHKTPASAEPAVRRNMEVTIARLNDLGVVVYDPGEGKVQ
jgi:hypothetical protein